jgi:ABC-2 type transport system permease protein
MLCFFLNLIFMGWWLGFLITALLIKPGPSAESLVWAFTFALAPVSAVYYPVTILPAWLQPLSHALPSSHVFEGLRALVLHQVFDAGEMMTAFLLNCGYMAFSMALLQAAFNNARKVGSLLQGGE